MDSFDHYATADLNKKYNVVAGSISAGGRNGTYCWQANSTQQLTKNLDAQSKWIVGMAVYFNTIDNFDRPLIDLLDSATSQVTLCTKANTGELVVKRGGSGGTVLETSVQQLTVSTFPFIEFKAVVGNAGSWEVRVNGDVWCQGTGDTQQTANAYANVLKLGVCTGFGQLDDLYVLDGNGSSNNDFLGDVRVEAIFPDGAGNYTQWTASSGINWQAVGERTPNSDTNYNYSSTSGQIDTFTFGNLVTASGTIYGVQTNLFARKDDATARRLRDFYRAGGVDYPGSGIDSLTTSYTYYNEIYELDPATSGVWTISAVNSAEFGYKNEG